MTERNQLLVAARYAIEHPGPRGAELRRALDALRTIMDMLPLPAYLPRTTCCGSTTPGTARSSNAQVHGPGYPGIVSFLPADTATALTLRRLGLPSPANRWGAAPAVTFAGLARPRSRPGR
jgi:hypothetical protein